MASSAQSRTLETVPVARESAYGLRRTLSSLVMYTILIGSAFIAIAPFLWMILQSLMTRGETLNRALVPRSALRAVSEGNLTQPFANYTMAWAEADFNLYFRNSIIISVITIVGVVVFSVLAAYAFARMNFPGKNLLFFLYLSTVMIPSSVLLIPNFLIVNWLHTHTPIQWLNNWPALTVPFWASAFSVFLLRQFFAQIPSDLWDAARIDGASHLRFMLQVVVPLSRAPILTVVLFTFIEAWNSLAWPLLVTTSPDWRPIAVGLYSFITEAGPDQHLLMAGALITMAPVLAMYFLFQKQFIENISRTGIKG